MKFTKEQERIFEIDLEAGETLKIVAFAGTGKTTTLVEYAKRHPEMNFLYLAFNKSVSEHAKEVFPRNVECRTSHSLAFEYYRKNFRRKRLVSEFDPSDVAEALGISDPLVVRAVIGGLTEFVQSDDDEILAEHIDTLELRGDFVNRMVVKLVRRFWKMIFKSNSDICVLTHDCYMKKYQLSKPDLSRDYDCVMLDEAQDSNPALADVVTRQKCAKIIVGDPHQSIYSFRGAVNVLETVEADYEMTLTRSFRFPKEIAKYANLILFKYKDEDRRVIGLGSGEPGGDSSVAYLTRTNSALFKVAVALSKKGKRFKIDDGMENYMNDLEYVDAVFHGRSTRWIRSVYYKFKTFDEMMDHALLYGDVRLKGICSLVRKHAAAEDIPKLVDIVRRHYSEFSDIVLHTVHRSKGMEFDTVVLTGFAPYGDMKDPKKHPNFQEEINIVYVAVTRAKRVVKLSSEIRELIEEDGEILAEEWEDTSVRTA